MQRALKGDAADARAVYMEEHIPDLARWLGSNAMLFFAVATAIALTVLGSLWYLLVHHTTTMVSWTARQWSRVSRYRAIKWLHRRLSRWSWIAALLTAYVIIAFATAGLGIMVFIELADEVEPDEDIAAFDGAFTASLRESTAHPTLVMFRFATHLGDPAFLIALSTIVALVLLWKRQRLLTAIWIIATAGNGLLTRVLKALFERTRPIHEHGLVMYEGWSFPSGHASGSLAVYTMLLYVVLRGREPRWWHLPVIVAAMALILIVGFSRVFLQVHYLSDVLAGYLVATSWLCVCIAAAEIARAYDGRLKVMPQAGSLT